MTTVREGPLSLTDPRVGCVLDGSDESAKVRAARAMLPAEGGELYLPPGALGLGATAHLGPGCTLTGSGTASTVRAAGGYAGTLLTLGFGASLASVKVDGTRTASTLVTVAAPRVRLTSLYLVDSAGDGLAFIGTAGTTAHAAQMSNLYIHGCAGRGLFVGPYGYDQEAVNVWIGECGTGLRAQSGDCTWTNLHVWHSTGNGVELRAANHRLANVFLESNGRHGLDASKALNAKVLGGSLWRNGRHGANLSHADRAHLSGLSAFDNDGDGIYAIDSSYGQVLGCQMYDTRRPVGQQRPLVTAGTSDGWVVTGNVARTADHARGGMTLAGSNIVGDNHIE